MNREHYQQVLDQITAHPETWDQTQWHCGTTHCFAGWAQLLSGHPAKDATVRRHARMYLDLSFEEANWLFSTEITLAELQGFRNGDHEADYSRAGYDRDGLDRAGYDRDGLDRQNRPRPGVIP